MSPLILTVFKTYKFHFIKDLIHLIYPEQCLVCEEELSTNERHVCSFCNQDIERTHFENYTEPTPMDQLFWGRQMIEKTYAHYYFKKQGGIQRLLFSLKYGKNPQLGVYLGEQIGQVISANRDQFLFDVLVPVPLHPKRLFQRGYNQSELLAEGITNIAGIPLDKSIIKRRANNRTQTGKSRFERWDNVESIFQVDKLKLKKHSHIAIIDDVITTGSTIESLITEIRNVSPDIKISVVTLAIA